jgi:hypothetical protein
MSIKIRSMAVLQAHPDKGPELVSLLSEFYTMMYRKQYSRDLLFRDAKQEGQFVHIRIWTSPEAREAAVHDPDVHYYWMKLPELAEITNIHENLETVFCTGDDAVADGSGEK